MDIIGKLTIAYTNEGGVLRFTIDEKAPEADLRAEFALANREVEAIKAEYASGDFPADMVDRIAVLQGYKKAIREIIVARVEAAALLNEEVDLPSSAPAAVEAPAPKTEAPAAPAAKVEEPAVIVPDFVIEGDGTIVDSEGNRYSRVTESMDDKAAALDSKQLESLAASLRPTAPSSPLLASVASDEDTDKRMAERAPMLAAFGGFNSGQDQAGGEITASRAGLMMLERAQARPAGDSKTYLFRQDRFQPLQAAHGLERLAGNKAVDLVVAQKQAEYADALLAAFCGPGELNRDQRVAVSNARPIATALGQASGTVAIGLGIHEFFRAIGLADLQAHYDDNPSAPVGIGQWNAADQAGVDTTDPDTWKGCFTLPDCPSTVQVSAYFLYRCLRVTVEDQMSRPQYVDNITTLMEAMLARSAESALLATIDAWSFNRTVPNTPGMGMMAQLYWAVEQVMAWTTSGNRIARSGYSLIIPEFLINMARIDAFFAGEDPGQVMSRMTEAAGGRLIITPDWGSEGNAMVPMPIQPHPDSTGPGDGDPIPLMPTSAVIRLLPLEDFVWGQTGVVDYGIETSPDLRRQNAALYFGEMAEIAYKNGGRPSFTLTLQNIVPNGARAVNFVDSSGLFAAGGGGAYNNTLPNLLKAGLPAAQFSGGPDLGS